LDLSAFVTEAAALLVV